MPDSKITLTCPGCNATFSARNFDISRNYACKKCGGRLAPPPDEALTVRVGPRPDEVEKASRNPKQKFGKYILVKKIGAGGMGQVYKAWDTILNRFVAIKTMLTALKEDILRFQREAQTAAQLRHPNIVEIYEVDEIDGKHFISMEYVEGKTLSRSKLTMKRYAEVARDIAMAVHAAHQKNIIHRDIKPTNIMIDPEGVTHVMDFGLAKSLKSSSQITMSGVVMGTPSYMSPEQAQDLRTIDHRTDIYSIGALLYHCLTGRPPFDEPDPVGTLQKVVNEEPVPPSKRAATVPKALETIILKCLDKNPERRYPDAKALASDLNRWMQGGNISATRLSVATRFGRHLRRRMTLVIAGGVAAAVVLITLLFLVLSTMSSSRRHEADVKALLSQADRLLTEKRWEEAKLAYDRVLGLEPHHRVAIVKRKTAADKLEEERAYDAIRKRDEERKRREAEEKRKKEEEAEEAKRKAQPEFDRGKSEYEEATLDLYRPDANLSRMHSRLRKALGHFDRAIQLNPTFQEAHLLRGRTHMSLGQLDEAEQDFGRAIELADTSAAAWIARGRLYLARVQEMIMRVGTRTREDLLQMKKWRDKAKEDLAQAMKLGVGGEEALFIDALVAYAHNNIPNALRLCADLILRRGSNEEAYNLKGNCLRAQKKYQDAFEAYSRAIELRVNYFEAYGNRGYARYLLGDFPGAIDDFSTALEINPSYVAGWVNRGTIKHKSGDVEGGAYDFRKALELSPGDATLLTNLGVLAMGEGRYQDAMDEFNRAIESSPCYGHAYMYRSMMYKRRKEPQKAMEDANTSVRLSGINDFMVWHNRGGLFYEYNRYPSAIRDYSKALQLKPDLPEAWYLRGKCHHQLKQLTNAESDFTQFIRLRPNSTNGYRARGDVRFDAENSNGAAQDYTKVLQIEPKNHRARFDRAACHMNLKQYDKAIEDYTAVAKAEEKFAELATLYRYRAEAYFHVGRFKECIADCDRALQLGSKDFGPLRALKAAAQKK